LQYLQLKRPLPFYKTFVMTL